jgi:hypothetical protein
LLNHRVPLRQLWTVLPREARQKTLRLLSGLIVRQLPEPSSAQEVKHDCH